MRAAISSAPTDIERSAVGALAMLAEQFGVLGRSTSVEELALLIRRNVKWFLPVSGERLYVRADDERWYRFPGGAPEDPPEGLRVVAERRTNIDLSGVDAGLDDVPRVRALELADGDRTVGILVVGLGAQERLEEDAAAILQFYALGVSAVLAKLLLIEKERFARCQADAATQSRDHMIASMVHDFRSPIAAALMSLECMARLDASGRSSEEQRREDLDDIKQSCVHMRDMVDDLLDASALRAGASIELRRRGVDLVALIRSVVGSVARKSGRDIDVDLPTPPVVGLYDGPRLRRVVANLVENAVKYSPAGDVVEVTATVEDDAFTLIVRDTGIGIPTVDLPRLFERFRRASNVGEIEGTGVGLATAYEVVVLHGGTLEVESKNGVGSTFAMRLPR